MKFYNNIELKLRNFSKTFLQYCSILKSFMADSIWRFKRESFIILFTGFLGVSFQVWTIGLALYYARAMEKGETINLRIYEFNARTSVILLVLSGIAILFSLSFAAWLIYFSRINNLALRRKYEEFCSKRIFLLLSSHFNVWGLFAQGIDNDKALMKLVRKDARYCGKVVWMLLDIFIPVITFLVAVGALLYINSFLTLLIFVLLSISAIFLYKVNILAAKNSSLMEKFAKLSRKDYLQAIRCQKNIAVLPSNNGNNCDENNFFSFGAPKKFLDAYIGRLKTLEYSQLISNIIFAVAVFLILLVLGGMIIFKGEGWGRLIIYLVALRFMLTNLRQINRKITGINRLYPQMRRYFQFLFVTEIPLDKTHKLRDSYIIEVSEIPALKSSLKRFTLKKGNKVSLVSRLKLNHYSLAFLTDIVLGHSHEDARRVLNSMRFVTSNYEPYPNRSFRKSIGLPPEYCYEDLKKDLSRIQLWDKYKELVPQDLDAPSTSSKWRQIDSTLKFALALINVFHSNCQWVMLEGLGLRSLFEASHKCCLDQLSDKIVIITFYDDLQAVGEYQEDVIAAVAFNEIIGLGDVSWFKQNQETIEEILNEEESNNKQKARAGIGDEDDDDDDF